MSISLALLIVMLSYHFRIIRQHVRYSFRQRTKILYALIMFCTTLLLSLLPRITFSQQVKLNKLEVPAGTAYNLDADTLEADELILKDSSKIKPTKPNVYVTANPITVWSGCSVIGV